MNGQAAVSVLTGDTGHAEVDFTLSPDAGNNIVEASFSSNPTSAAQFVIFGIQRDVNQPTSFSGLVLNNNEQPIQGATCTLAVGGTTLPAVSSDIDGLFRFDPVAGSGPADLHVDGLTATRVGGAGGSGCHLEPFLCYPDTDRRDGSTHSDRRGRERQPSDRSQHRVDQLGRHCGRGQ